MAKRKGKRTISGEKSFLVKYYAPDMKWISAKTKKGAIQKLKSEMSRYQLGKPIRIKIREEQEVKKLKKVI